MKFYKIKIFVFLVFLLSLQGCGVYSFTGASIPKEAKTISIHYFPNKALYIIPTLSQKFTDALKDRFLSQTTLNQVDNSGDLNIEGEITGLSTQPVAIQGGSTPTAQLNRLTITVNVRFTNRFDEKQNFETSFSRYLDYDSRLSMAQVENTTDVITQINNALIDDIFNKAVVNW